jgi:hypothetical protein
MKRMKIDVECAIEGIKSTTLQKKKITAERLDLDYVVLFSKDIASEILNQIENSVEYLEGDLSKVGKY